MTVLLGGIAAQKIEPASTPRPSRLDPAVRALLSHGSDGFLLGGKKVARTRDLKALRVLSKDRDSELSRVARGMLQLEDLARTVDRLGSAHGAGGAGVRAVQRELTGIVRGIAAHAGSDLDRLGWGAAQLTGPSGLVTRLHQDLALKRAGVAVDHLVRSDAALALHRYFRRTHAELKGLPLQSLPRTLRRFGSDALLGLDNRTGKLLRDCVFVLRFVPDLAEIEKHRQAKVRRDAAGWKVAGRISNPAALDAMRASEETLWALQRVDKCAICFLDTWRPGSRIELPLADFQAVAAAGKRARLSIWCAEGSLIELELPMSEYRRKMRAEVDRVLKPAPKRRRR